MLGDFGGKAIALTRSGFELIGASVFDDSEAGVLYVGDPPELCPTPDVVWVRVGRDEQRADWKGTNFSPAERSVADVLHGRQGRFYVRVYDADVRLLDSSQFRYLRDLREIRVNGEPYTANTLLVPSPAGHARTEVSLLRRPRPRHVVAAPCRGAIAGRHHCRPSTGCDTARVRSFVRNGQRGFCHPVASCLVADREIRWQPVRVARHGRNVVAAAFP